ncbi:MAG: NAD-dependent DNA ligase LigA [Muribaculaceae bacterium]|nr:NAD-dependent DNA ligase LigA [Muribaculaceae bacterium]
MADIFEQRILDLRKEINEYNHQYYVLNAPTISDKEFDDKLRELQDLEESYPQYFDAYSPTQRVGSDLTQGFKQVKHARPMISLSNSYSVEEVADFLTRAENGLNGERCEIVGEMKFDGTSISLIYNKGRLERAVTRGDGEKGDDVTANVLTIKSIPLRLPADSNYPESFEIRGEILLPWKQFDKLNQEREAKNEPLFANPRNAAAGTLKLQNSAEVARRGLDAYFYYILSDNLPFDNHFDNMQQAKNWGFKVAPVMQILNSIDEVRDFISHWDIERKQLPVATDGLVFKINNLRQQLNLGSTAKSPRWAVAFKFQAERACTPLKFVSFEVGRTGVVTPVANLEPVLLSGTIVKRASLHNEDIIRSLDIHNGDHVYVEKGGEIIPKIVGVELSKRIPDSTPLLFVTHCPVCGTPLTRIEGEAAWICPNKYECQPQIVGKIEHFVGRRMMNIDGIGEEVADQLFSVGLVTNIADLYDLTEEKLTNLDRFQTKSAQRILKGINESRNVPFERVIFALSIPFVGETTAKVLAEATHNIDTLMSLNEEQLSSINEIGDKIAKSIVAFFKNDTNRNTIERLRNAGLQMAISEDELLNKTDKLEGKSIVISGTFALHSRDEYKKMIAQNGGKNVSSISAKTDFVFAGENMGPAKLEKAQKLGIPIINEEEFLKMIE